MKRLNKKSQAIFEFLTGELDGPRIFDNAPGVFMAAHVEYLYSNELGKIYSITHYYKQNGDMMQDPDMTFLAAKVGIYPLTYQQDGLGLYQEAVTFDNGKIHFQPKLQADLTKFANGWMLNIKQQQKLQLTA